MIVLPFFNGSFSSYSTIEKHATNLEAPEAIDESYDPLLVLGDLADHGVAPADVIRWFRESCCQLYLEAFGDKMKDIMKIVFPWYCPEKRIVNRMPVKTDILGWMRNPAEQIADEILVMDAQSGRREAFDMLVLRRQKRLWWHALNLTGRTEAAWDITQESWLDIGRGLTRLNDPAKFGAWAYRIVSYKAYDWRRGADRKYSPEIEPEDTLAVTAELGKHETAGDVRDILRRLSGRAQVVLNLYYLEGFSLAEIAGILGTPEGTVKARLHAARIEFRKHWESLG